MNLLDYKYKLIGRVYRGEGGGGDGGGGADTGTDIGNAAQDSQANTSTGNTVGNVSDVSYSDVGSFGPVASVTPETAPVETSPLSPTDIGSFSPVTSVDLTSSTAKPGETTMAQTASQTGGTNLSTAALAGTLDSTSLTKSDLGALQAMGFGNLTGVNKNNPTQTIDQLYNSYALNEFLTDNLSASTIASMVAGPIAGLLVDVATSLAQGKSPTSVLGNVVGSILGQAISQTTGVPVSLSTLTALVDGQVGRAGLSVAFNAVAQQTGLSSKSVEQALTGNLGAAVQNTVVGALTSEAAKTLGVDPQFMGQVLGSTGLSSTIGTNVAGFVNQLAAPINEVTAQISNSISSIGVPTGVNNLAGAISSGQVNTTPVGAEGGNQEEYLKQVALNSGISPAQAQTNINTPPKSSGGININWGGVFGEVSQANNKLPVVPVATGTSGTTGAMQGGFGSGTTSDVISDLTNAGLTEDLSQDAVNDILGTTTFGALKTAIQNGNLTAEERGILLSALEAEPTAQALPITQITSDAGSTVGARYGSPFAANDPRIAPILAKNPQLLKSIGEYTNAYGYTTAAQDSGYLQNLMEAASISPPNIAQSFKEEIEKVIARNPSLTSLVPNNLRVAPNLSELEQTDVGSFGPVTSVVTDDVLQDILNGGTTSSTGSPSNQEILDSIGYTPTPAPAPAPAPAPTPAPAPSVTQQDVTKIVADAFKANPSLTQAQVTQIVNDAVAATPAGTTPGQVQSIVDTAIKAIPAGLTTTDVSKIVSDAFKANPYVSQEQVASLISDAVGKIPPGMTAVDVGKIVNSAIANIPAGLSTADVSKVVSDAIAKIPAGISTADVTKIVGDAIKAIPAGLSRTDVDTIVKNALAANPSLTQDQVTKIVSDQIAKIPAGITAAQVKSQVDSAIGAPASGTTAATGVYAAIQSTSDSLSKAIADAKASGLAGDAALKAAIDKVAADQGVTAASLLSKIGTTEANLKSQFASQISGVQTQIAGVQASLQQAIQAAKDIGLQGDAALQAGIDSVAANLGVTKAALLTQLGTTEANLKAQFATQLGAVQQSVATLQKTLSDTIAANEKAGLTRDQATQKALADVATQMGTDKATLLNKIGATEANLNQKLAAGLQDVTGKITATEKALSDAIQAAKDIGLKGDAALQAGIDSVAANLGVTKAALLSELGTTEANLKAQFATQLGAVQQSVTELEQTLTTAIAANEKAGLSRDQATQKALADVSAQMGTDKATLLNTIGATEATLNQKLASVAQSLESQLTAQGKQFRDALVQQGMTQQQALETAIAAQNEAIKTGQSQTQAAINNLSAAQQKEVADRIAAGQETNAAIAAVKAQVTAGQTALGNQLTAQGKQFMDALVAQGMSQQQALETAVAAQNEQARANQQATQQQIGGVQTQLNERIDQLTKTGMDQFTATQTALREMNTSLTGQLSAAEAQRQADMAAAAAQRQADQEAAAAAAAAAEKQRQADIEAQKAREAANLRTTQVGQLRGQMMTGLQGLMGGLQQQATQMAAPGQVETVKATPGFDFSSPLNVGFFSGYESQKVPPKGQESTKIAEGGYLDDLLDAIR